MKILRNTFFIVIVSASIIHSQSSSTYTRNGIGDLNYTYSARSLGFAHTGVAMFNSDFVEILNPASWAELKFTKIEFSLALNGVRLSDSNESGFYTDAEFKGFTFSFPISQKYKIGFAAGIVPYSRISYKVVEMTESTESIKSNYTTTYEGDGGLSKLFMGATYKLPIGFTFGASGEFYFGKQTYSSLVEFTNSSFVSAEYELDYRSTGFGTTVGIITDNFSGLLNSETISNLNFGVSVNVISELSTDTSLTINPSSVADTITSGGTTMKIPIRVVAGISLVLNNKYNFNLDYIYQPWSQYTFSGVNTPNLRDVHRFGLGFEHALVYQPGRTTWEQIRWRLGLSYVMTQYVINGTDITQFGTYAGLSFPLGVGNTFDLDFEYSFRGTTDNNLVQENFFRINVGISFGEIWFQRVQK
ncbi:MAG: hypothetical protein JSW63_09865 [Ignavibacterium sp.]|nr:MAG: hypothetical protein JSW63_09865 [Ignavibacterium sp.]